MLFFPCVITQEDDIYYANFPGLDNVFTDGETLEEVVDNAKDVLKGMLFSMYKNNIEIPKPISYKAKDDEMVIYIEIWEEPIKDKANQQSIKKTLTIPKWLNDLSEEKSINFSSVLQFALKKELGL